MTSLGIVASGNTLAPPAPPPLVGWYDASDAATFTETGGFVDQWRDKSGKNWHLSSTGTDRPARAGRRTGCRPSASPSH